jgi:predicted tellurium resistance membrane protein TerC
LELFSPEFFSALLAIIVIDLVLAGDNAIVIAMAARNLPPHLQKKAIVWGAVGAIAVRSAMTLIVVYLLQIPGLMLVGGALLIWIAYRLLKPEGGDGEGHGGAATTFWGAMKTIIIADAVMGISIPIVIWGSTMILKVVERYPAVIYLGAGVLAWTAAKMIANEPFIKESEYALNPMINYAFQIVVIVGVLMSGYVRGKSSLNKA